LDLDRIGRVEKSAVVDCLDAYVRAWETNIFVIEFDDGGVCRSFSEWFVAPRGQSAT